MCIVHSVLPFHSDRVFVARWLWCCVTFAQIASGIPEQQPGWNTKPLVHWMTGWLVAQRGNRAKEATTIHPHLHSFSLSLSSICVMNRKGRQANIQAGTQTGSEWGSCRASQSVSWPTVDICSQHLNDNYAVAVNSIQSAGNWNYVPNCSRVCNYEGYYDDSVPFLRALWSTSVGCPQPITDIIRKYRTAGHLRYGSDNNPEPPPVIIKKSDKLSGGRGGGKESEGRCESGRGKLLIVRATDHGCWPNYKSWTHWGLLIKIGLFSLI